MTITEALPLGQLSALAYARLSRGMTQRELSAVSGVPGQQICAYENGRVAPSAWTRLRLARALGVAEETLWPDLEPSSSIPVLAEPETAAA